LHPGVALDRGLALRQGASRGSHYQYGENPDAEPPSSGFYMRLLDVPNDYAFLPRQAPDLEEFQGIVAHAPGRTRRRLKMVVYFSRFTVWLVIVIVIVVVIGIL
jgi:hypothetical protein